MPVTGKAEKFRIMRHNKAQALIAAILIIVMLSFFATMIASLFATQVSNTASGLAESTQVFYLAHGGLEWYMQQLAEDSDWTDQINPATQTLGSGTFDIELSNISAGSIDVKAIGKVTGPDQRDRERWVAATIKRTPVIPEYAVFWHQDGPGSQLDFANSSGGTHVVGDMWSIGSSDIGTNSEVTGIIYHAQGESITGGGSYTAQELTPSPTIPLLDTTYYDGLMADWNSRIDAANVNNHGQTGGSNLTLNSHVDWTGQTINQKNINTNGYDITGTNFTVNCRSFNLQTGSEIDSNASGFTINVRNNFAMSGSSQINADDYRINTSNNFTMSGTSAVSSSNFEFYLDDNFNTDGTVSLAGNGYVVCSDAGSILLHNANGDSGVFTATPSGGSIYFLSGDSMTVNSNKNDTDVTLNANCFLYSRNPGGSNDLLRIRNEDTSIDQATIIAERRIIVEKGADVTDSTLYLDRGSGNSNNFLQVTGSSTTVTGSLLSQGREYPSLRVRDSASVTGLVYDYDGVGTRGRARVDGSSTIAGALLVRQFYNDNFGPATITYDSNSIPSPLPNGFDSSRVMVDSGTWDGL